MISPAQDVAPVDSNARGAFDAAEAVGWGWTQEPHMLHRHRPLLGRSVTILGWAAGAAAILLFAGFLAFVYSLERTEERPGTRADAIVALTGGSERVGDAIDLLAQGYGRRLLITGVNEKTSRAQIARLNPGQQRLVECCVDLDYRARNTIGNAIETRRWVERHGFRSFIVVTSNYHMPRTLVELGHAMPSLRVVPYAVVPDTIDPRAWWHDLPTARILVSEYVKLLLVWPRTHLEADPERSAAANLMSGGRPVKPFPEPMLN